MGAAIVSGIVRCDPAGLDVRPTLEGLAGQAAVGVETLLLVPASVDDRLLAYYLDLGRRLDVRVVRVAGETAGAVRNTGVEQSRAPYIMMPDAGDRLDPRWAAAAAQHLDAHPDVGFVTSWVREEAGGADASSVRIPPGCDFLTVLARPDVVHAGSVFRRSAWEGVGGFDVTLTALEGWEFWLRLLGAGWRGAVLAAPLLSHRIGAATPWRRFLEQARDAGCLQAVFDRHRAALAEDPAVVLLAQERAIRSLRRDHDPRFDRRNARVAELTTARDEARRLEADLANEGRGTLDWGDLRRTSPVDANWGYGRGTPIDRYYIERFLEAHAADVRGTVLEVQEAD
ncbi:MAG: glycosyltransferase [Candidatus Rokuibacteriota bacterium]